MIQMGLVSVKQIGDTIYIVRSRTSTTANETAYEKVRRLILEDAKNEQRITPKTLLFPFIGTQAVTPLVEREWRDPLPLFLGYAGNGMTSLSGGRIFGCCSSGCIALSTRPISR